MREQLRGLIGPVQGLYDDPEYARWAQQQATTITFVLGGLIVVFNPVFHVLLKGWDLPSERLIWRVIPMIASSGAIVAMTFPAARKRAVEVLTAHFLIQLICLDMLVLGSGNHPVYAGASLVVFITAQLAFVRIGHLLGSMAASYAFLLVGSALSGHLAQPSDIFALMMVGAGHLVSMLLGAVRIRTLERVVSGRLELAARQGALERAEAQARDAALQADAANRAKSAFLANMSHELRTPLNAIIGYSEMIAEQADDEGFPQVVPDLVRVQKSARHLLALIDDVLDLSKIEADRLELVLQDFPIAELVDEVRAVGVVLAETRNNTFTVLAEVGSARAVTDRGRLVQILSNLLSNACKFTRQGTVRLEVTLDGDQLVARVADTGDGMSGEQVAALFQAFVQVHDPARREDVGGTGLGLVLCRRFARLMGGDVEVQSAPGAGSTFTTRVPLIAPSAAPAA
jgi:signal transduction histidine kinase